MFHIHRSSNLFRSKIVDSFRSPLFFKEDETLIFPSPILLPENVNDD